MSIDLGEPTPFFGRRRELRAVGKLVAPGQVVTLTGIGGVGKTRLAWRVAANRTEELGSRVWIVALEDLFDGRWLLPRVCRAVGLGAEASTLSHLVGFLSERPSLLVLDNCEHLQTACAALVTRLTASCPELALLCTSREPLGTPHERVYAVPPLPVPPTGTEPGADLETYASVALFVERAAARDPGFMLTDTNASAVAQLCSDLEGIPLSLELAAARIRVLSPSAMLGLLEDRYRLLARGYTDAADRLSSLEASMDWTWDLCTPDERRLWSRLSVFVGGVDLDGAAAVLEVADRDQVSELLASLVDKALLSREPTAPDRFHMLETIRQYGARRLASDEGPELTMDLRDAWVLELAESFERHWAGPTQVEWADRLRWHESNIRHTLTRASDDPEAAALALRIVTALESYWVKGGFFTEPRAWLARALATSAGSAAERSKAYGLDAQLAIVRSEPASARAQLQKAQELSGVANDPAASAYVDYVSGLSTLFTGAIDEAVPLLQRSLEAQRALGADSRVIPILSTLSLAFSFLGDREQAAEARRECLALTDSLGERFQRSYVLWAIGLDALQEGDLDGAEAALQEALELKTGLSDHVGSALVFEVMAAVAAQREDPRRVAALLGAAEGVWLRSDAASRDNPLLAEPRHRAETMLAAASDAEVLDEIRREAASWPLEDAVSLALGGAASQEGPASAADLSARELEVAALVAQGLTDREIAERLVISVRTVQGHMQRILGKLGLSNRTQVAAWFASR